MTIVVMAFMCVGFAACGGSDDDGSAGGGSSNNSLVGTWRKYGSSTDGTPSGELEYVLWVFNADGTMYEHDIDENLNIKAGHTERFNYRTENGHLYTQEVEDDGSVDKWKDEGAYVISGDILEITKDSGKVRRLKKIG
ncbi:MAG: hypothetical protein IJ144_05250 [Prevotella sp.]|nr:hypothetical protein [Prevotella sp.]